MKRVPLLVCLVLLLLFVTGVPAAASGAPTLSSITPPGGETNTTVSITSLSGKNFDEGAGFRLRRAPSRDVVGSVKTVNSSTITGTINLDKTVPGDYEVCVFNNASTFTCDLTFTVTPPREAATASSIFFETSPTGAIVLLNGVRIGTSAFTYQNATPGTYKVIIQKGGYEDYTGSVTVSEGKRTRFYALLTPRGGGTTAMTTLPVQTATTIRKSTLNVPTTWPTAADTPTPLSAVDPLVTTAAAAAGTLILVVRRR